MLANDIHCPECLYGFNDTSWRGLCTCPEPRVLIMCETSGELRRRWLDRGAVCLSVDLLPADDGDVCNHVMGDALAALRAAVWDLVIAHPPCTYLAASGLHWNRRVPGRADKTEHALEFVRQIWESPNARRLCIENPVGAIGTRIAKASQYVQPYEFGDDASKRTGLWLRGLPCLVPDPDKRIPGRMVNGRERWANQTDSGQNALGPSADRWKARSKTYPGIADAMVSQWAPILFSNNQTDGDA